MMRDIGAFLVALSEIPGLKFLREPGRTLQRVGRTKNNIENTGARLKKRYDKTQSNQNSKRKAG